MERRVLVVDDDPSVRGIVARLVRRRLPGTVVLEAASGEEALRLLEGRGDGVTVVTDLHLGSGMEGDRLLEVVHERHPGARRVLLTGAPDAKADADAIVEKGVQFPGLIDAL